MGFWGNLLLAWGEAWLFSNLLNFAPVRWFVGTFLGIAISTKSLFVIFFVFNTLGLWRMWSMATGSTQNMWSRLFQNKWLSWGVFNILIGVLRFKEVGFAPKIPSLLGLRDLIGPALGITPAGYLPIISFSIKPDLSMIQIPVGVIFILIFMWQNWKGKAAREGRAAEFPLLGWLKRRGPRIGAPQAGLDKALYMAAGNLAPLVEHEYKGVILKINELKEQQRKGKSIPYHVLSDLMKSKEYIEKKITQKIVETGGVQHPYLSDLVKEMREQGAEQKYIEAMKVKGAFNYINQMTLPSTKKFLKKERKVRGR